MKKMTSNKILVDQFVPYGVALALKNVGFNEPCFLVYHDKKMYGIAQFSHGPSDFHIPITFNSELGQSSATAPLLQQVQDWFEKKGFQVYAFKLAGTWYWKIDDNFSTVEYWVGDGFKDKRTALIKGINKAIELVSVAIKK